MLNLYQQFVNNSKRGNEFTKNCTNIYSRNCNFVYKMLYQKHLATKKLNLISNVKETIVI